MHKIIRIKCKTCKLNSNFQLSFIKRAILSHQINRLPDLKILIMMGTEKYRGTFNFDNILEAASSAEVKAIYDIQDMIQFDEPVNIQFTSVRNQKFISCPLLRIKHAVWEFCIIVTIYSFWSVCKKIVMVFIRGVFKKLSTRIGFHKSD